jgi:two-component system response regulator NreC
VARTRILLAEDHTLVREGFRRILEAQPGFEVVGEAGDGREAVRQALSLKPDVAVLDVRMPLLNGIDATRQIVHALPDARVLILSMHPDESYVLQVVRAGARGYLLKDAAADDLIEAVGAVAAGRMFFSPAVANVMLGNYVRQLAEQGVTDRYELLSDREREIFQLIAEGHGNKAIASRLNISPKTVATHRANIMEKLDLHGTAELVLFAVRRGIIR